MDLTVIIVNYNVKYFLEQCIHAVLKASQTIKTEIIVVDNHSADGSVQMLKEKFPEVIVIANTVNLGFAKANNQAIYKANGKYILLLNPDTVVGEDTFVKCIGYLKEHPDVGSLGVKMINGNGKYLPESKRALPKPLTAFYKIFGLAAMFPRSKKFGRYHLGHLNRDEIHEVDVISGAFMLLRKSALEKSGLLDERFFMYAEDIDLSYRIKQEGFRNIYFPETTIIHYKGESTRKSSINYVILFYRAMILFAKKHFSGKRLQYFISLIYIAIYFRALMSILRRCFLKIINPFLDFGLIYIGYRFFLPVWEIYHFGSAGSYPPMYMKFVVPVYILIWICAVFLVTGYGKRVKLSGIFKGVLAGSLTIIVIYALLPETLRFSRALILLGSGWTFFSMVATRYFLSRIIRNVYQLEISSRKKRIIIVGSLKESRRVYNIISSVHVIPDLVGFVSPDDEAVEKGFIGNIRQLNEIVTVNQAEELIFCASDLSAEKIIQTMLQLPELGIDYKIAAPECLTVIGSSSGESTGDLYNLHFNALSLKRNRRTKRFFDIVCSLALFILSPVLVTIVKYPLTFFSNIVKVLAGFYSWVGYYQTTGGDHPGLPVIKPAVLSLFDRIHVTNPGQSFVEKSNLQYAKDYSIFNDLRIILSGLRNLGRKPEVLTKS